MDFIQIAKNAKRASLEIAGTTSEVKNSALLAIAKAFEQNKNEIFEANKKDLEQAQKLVEENKLSQSTYNRLKLDENKMRDMIQGVRDIANLEEQKEIINLTVKTLEEYIESRYDDFKEIHDDKLFLAELKFNPLYEKSLEIINDEELVSDVLDKAINRLNIRLVIWDYDKCTNCQLCVGECGPFAAG